MMLPGAVLFICLIVLVQSCYFVMLCVICEIVIMHCHKSEVVVDHRKNSCCIAVADEDPKKRNKTLYHEAPIRKSATTKHSTYLQWFGL